MSHEIRTPMNAVVNMTRLLLDTPLNRKQLDFAETAMTSSEILLSVINDILDFSKIEAGKLELESTDFNLTDIVSSVVKIMEIKAAEKGIRLKYRIDEDVHPYLTGDPARLRQILLNFLNNALKFTRNGSIDIHAGSENQTETHITLKFSVTDTGIGISREHKDRLFKPFSQADASTSRKYGGTGLGLIISKQLAELMHGDAGVESEEGRGSTFWFTAVFDKIESLTAIQNSQDSEVLETSHACSSCFRILLAEDNTINQLVALAILEQYGFSADIADNGCEAVEALKKTPYDLVLMDMQMPGTDGIEAARIIRDPESGVINPDIPIVAMTANATTEARKKCFDAGMNDYISKPVDPNQLLSVISKFLPVSVKAETGNKPETPCDVPVSEIFNYQEFRNRMSGMDQSVLINCIKQLTKNLSREIEKLDSALNEKNAANIRLYAHSIRGMCANASADKISETAHQIEIMGEQGNTEIDGLLKELKEEYETLVSFISDMFPGIFIPEDDPEIDEKEEIFTEQAKAKLPELISCLENEIIPQWDQIMDVFFLDDIIEFTEKLNHIAEKYQAGILANYSRKLHKAAQDYDFEKITDNFSRFPELIDKIKKI
ncbi:Signal transduction response regulator, receiver domain histidine kinase, Hpt-like [Desulfonema limicola]|uniref:histidine kinase n=1 Tax=Desulfonema limicola TaxID=45656 RepID=A0A975BBG2_9BACT|nr:ATP-binding protein [Desulfonema limicola]QTA82160.1 Signal transduction response regulator, receiver domain histidine kinase, Hpt-like [Desulfonema limicola]